MPRDPKLTQELLSAVEESNLDSVKFVFETKMKKQPSRFSLTCVGDSDEKIARDCEPVTLAAAKLDDPAVLKYLIDNGMSVNFVNEAPGGNGSGTKLGPLHVAVINNQIESVLVLLEANADINRTDHNGRTPLHLAVKRANCEMCRLLLSNGASTYTTDSVGVTPLQCATRYGHVELVRILLEHDAHVFQKGQKGASPLHLAAMEGHVPLIDLFSRYVDINIKTECSVRNKEQTALHLAAERGLIETVKFMVAKFGADVDVLDSDQQTALHYAVCRRHDYRRMRRKEDFELTVDFLLKKGINFQQANKNGDTALHFAAQNQFHRVVEILLIAGADQNLKNTSDQSPSDLVPEFDMPMKQLFSSSSPRIFQLTGHISVTESSLLSPRLLRMRNITNVSNLAVNDLVKDTKCSLNIACASSQATSRQK